MGAVRVCGACASASDAGDAGNSDGSGPLDAGNPVDGGGGLTALENAVGPLAIAVDTNGVYFTSTTSVGDAAGVTDAVYSCGLTSCPTPALVLSTTTAVEQAPGAPAIASGTLYVPFTGGGVVVVSETAMASPGTTYVSVVNSGLVTIAIEGTNAYYDDPTNVYVSPLTPVPATPTAVITGAFTHLLDVTVDTLNVYATDSSGLVVSCPLGTTCGASYTTIASGLATQPNAVVSDGTNLWFGGGSGLWKCPIGTACGTAPAKFATPGNLRDLVVDANYVYWADAFPGGIYRCPVGSSTCASPTLMASLPNAEAIAQNVTTLYVSDRQTLYMLPK